MVNGVVLFVDLTRLWSSTTVLPLHVVPDSSQDHTPHPRPTILEADFFSISRRVQTLSDAPPLSLRVPPLFRTRSDLNRGVCDLEGGVIRCIRPREYIDPP